MKRDKQLMYYLLLQARDGNAPEALAAYPEDEKVYNAALLIEDGYVRGEALPGHDGKYITAVLEDLTSLGHDLLEDMEKQVNRRATANVSESKPQVAASVVSVFISHSSKDKSVASALIDLLRSAVGLSEKEMRCSSVDGYRFEVGAETDAQLKKEVKGSKVFIGLITPASIQSAYVLFELGARWGADLHLAPLLACGANSDFLKGPLRGLNALNATSEAEMHQLIHDVALRLDRTHANAAVYGKALQIFITAVSRGGDQQESMATPHASRSSAIPKQIMEDILRAMVRGEEMTAERFSRMSGQSIVRSQHYLSTLESEGFLEEHFRDSGAFFDLTDKGRAYVVANDLDKL